MVIEKMKLIDRNYETEYIIKDINKFTEKKQNRILFVWADSGIGKTSTIKKVGLQKELTREIICIDTPPLNTNDVVENGTFIGYVAESLDSFFKKEGWGLKDFLVQGFSCRQQKKELSKLLTSVSTMPITAFSLLCERLLQLNDNDAEKIINSIELENILINIEYIKFILDMYNVVIDITNTQNMDPLSMNELKKLFAQGNNLYFIFEYTTINNDTTNLWRLAKSFENVAKIEVFGLNCLPIEYALTIIAPDGICDVNKVEEFYANTAKGNLYKMFSARSELNLIGSQDVYKDPIEVKISKLNYSQKLILGIVCLYDGCIPIREYDEIIEYISPSFFLNRDDIYSLNGLVNTEQENSFSVCHASVIDSFNICIENYAALVAYKFLSEYYIFKSSKMDLDISQQNQYMFKLLKLYSIFDPIKILERITDFRQLLNSSLSEEYGANIIQNIYNSISDKELDVKIQIINIAYESGFYQTAYSLVDRLKADDTRIFLLKIMLLNRIDKHDKVLDLCKKILKGKCDLRTELVTKMIRMLSERSQNNEKAYQKTFKSLFNNSKYKDIYEYGFLLRNSQIVYSFSDSIQFINESIDFFEKRNQTKDMACSKLTLAVQNARLGNLSEAKNIIEKIEFTLMDTTFEKHIIYMDKAAISLLEETADDETLILLQKSYLTATTSFDKVVILNNQLCWYILHKVEENLFLKLKQQLDKLLETEPDLRLHRRTFINYSKYYQNVMNDPITANKMLVKAACIDVSNDDISDAFINGTCNDKNLLFLSKRPYYVSFITYWHFDLPMN